MHVWCIATFDLDNYKRRSLYTGQLKNHNKKKSQGVKSGGFGGFSRWKVRLRIPVSPNVAFRTLITGYLMSGGAPSCMNVKKFRIFISCMMVRLHPIKPLYICHLSWKQFAMYHWKFPRRKIKAND